jgi:hypothetical protein
MAFAAEVHRARPKEESYLLGSDPTIFLCVSATSSGATPAQNTTSFALGAVYDQVEDHLFSSRFA